MRRLAYEHLEDKAIEIIDALELRRTWQRGEIENPDRVFRKILRDDYKVTVSWKAIKKAREDHATQAAE